MIGTAAFLLILVGAFLVIRAVRRQAKTNEEVLFGSTVVAATAGLTVDQSVKNCVRDEQKAKQQLAGQWSKFPAPSRASCTSQESIGGTPSYVSLQTCLQMGQWAR